MRIIKWGIIVLFLTGFTSSINAIDYYWIGKGVNTNWSTPGNWATSSGAAASDVLYPPTANDNVIFDEKSFTTVQRTIVINTGSTCDHITFRNIPEGILPVLTINAGLTVRGSMTLWTGMTVNGTGVQTFSFQSDRANETIVIPAGILFPNTNFVFDTPANYAITGDVRCNNFTKTNAGNIDISGYLQTATAHTNFIDFSGGGNLTVGNYVSAGGAFTFQGDGDLMINTYLTTIATPHWGNLFTRSVYLSGTGTKTIKDFIEAKSGIVADGGTVNIGGDLIMAGYFTQVNSDTTYPKQLTGADPSVYGGCKMTVGGNITGNGMFSVSGAGTEVEVQGGYVTLFNLFTINGGKFLASETVQCNNGWYNNGGVDFTAATAPKLIRIGSGDLIANAGDIYNNVDFYGTPLRNSRIVTNHSNHTLNRGTYNRITFSGGNGRISTAAGIITDSLVIYAQAAYLLGNTTTVNEYLEIKPRPCGGMVYVGGGTFAMKAGSTVNVENAWLKNNTITGATPTAVNSVDGGGNTGWSFSEASNTYYWVGGAGAWNEVEHWADESGGNAGSGCIPTIFDNVVFDGKSGLNGTETVTIPATAYAYCNNMTWHDITGTPILAIPLAISNVNTTLSTRLYIGGSLELNPGMKLTNTNIPADNGWGIHFVSNRPSETIITNGVAIPGCIYFNSGAVIPGGTGRWEFQDDWTGKARIYFQQGNLDFNGKSVTAYWLNSTAGTRTLNIAGSTIEMSEHWTYNGTGSTLTDAAGSLVKVINKRNPDGSDGGDVWYGFDVDAGDRYNNLEFSTPTTWGNFGNTRTITNGIFNKITLGDAADIGRGIILSGTIVADSLILSAKGGATYTLNNNITVNRYLQGPDCGQLSSLTSNNTTVRAIIMGSSGIAGENVNMKNMRITRINIVDEVPGSLMPSGGYLAENCEKGTGAETGWNVTSLYIAGRYYWVGGSGNWSDLSHWSATSGGGYPSNDFCLIPQPHNTVVFDENSFKATGQVVTIDVAARCDSMLWVGTVSEKPTLKMGANLTVSGSMELQQNMLSAYIGGQVQFILMFNSIRSSESLKTNGVSLSEGRINVTFNVTGEWDIPNGLRGYGPITFGGPVDSTPKWKFGGSLSQGKIDDRIFFNRGTLDLSGQSVTTNSFTHSSGDPNRELIIRNATVNLAVRSNNTTGIALDYNGKLTEENSLNSQIRVSGGTTINEITRLITAAGQVYNDVSFSLTVSSAVGSINAPTGANTTRFRNVTIAGTQPVTTNNGIYRKVLFNSTTALGTTNNGKFGYLHFKGNGTMSGIEADTLRFANNSSSRVYTFVSGAANTSTINKKWYGSGLPCYLIAIHSSVPEEPAYLNIKEAAATHYNSVHAADVLFLDYVRVNGIVANKGAGLSMLEKGSGSSDDEVISGRIYNPTGDLGGWAMSPAHGWLRNAYNLSLSPLPNRNIPCDAFPFIIDPVQYVPTPESTYEWRKGGPTGEILSTDPIYTINTTDDIGNIYLKVDYHPEGASCALDGMGTITTSSKDSLIWTGAVDTDWNDANNWELPNGSTALYAPTVCTDVLIPEGLSIYPDLLPVSGTDYTQEFYDKAACRHIHFEHGGEVRRTDSLHYEKAFVSMQLNSNQWYLLSSPLGDTYSGDFYIDTPNPIRDLVTPDYREGRGLLTYMMHFDIGNYQTGSDKIPYGWNNAFNTNDVKISAGQGFALFSNPRGSGYEDQNELTGKPFLFPKNDPFYYYYDRTGVPFGRGNDLTRTFSHRFIYEENIDSEGIVPLSHSSLSDGKMVLVGNPFMSQLDFDAFVTDSHNSILIYDEYKIATGVNGTTGLINDFTTYKRVGGTYITSNPAPEKTLPPRYIPPMQSFIVYGRQAGGTLRADIEHHTATGTGNHLRSSNEQHFSNKELLYVTAKRDKQESHAVLVHWEGGSKDFFPEEDSRKLFDETAFAPVLIYLQSGDRIALDIHTTDDLTEIPVGIRTSQTGEITLNFSGMESFGNRTIYLHDRKTGQVVDLKEQNGYVFSKDEPDLFIENRFYIVFGSPTGLDTSIENRISVINPAPRTIQIMSDEPLGTVEIIDLQGIILANKEDICNSQYSYQVPFPGVYIVRVMGEARKIIVK